MTLTNSPSGHPRCSLQSTCISCIITTDQIEAKPSFPSPLLLHRDNPSTLQTFSSRPHTSSPSPLFSRPAVRARTGRNHSSGFSPPHSAPKRSSVDHHLTTPLGISTTKREQGGNPAQSIMIIQKEIEEPTEEDPSLATVSTSRPGIRDITRQRDSFVPSHAKPYHPACSPGLNNPSAVQTCRRPWSPH